MIQMQINQLTMNTLSNSSTSLSKLSSPPPSPSSSSSSQQQQQQQHPVTTTVPPTQALSSTTSKIFRFETLQNHACSSKLPQTPTKASSTLPPQFQSSLSSLSNFSLSPSYLGNNNNNRSKTSLVKNQLNILNNKSNAPPQQQQPTKPSPPLLKPSTLRHQKSESHLTTNHQTTTTTLPPPLKQRQTLTPSTTTLLPETICDTPTATTTTNWVPMKNHSLKCNIMLKKQKRGNKRSKSLPPKFSIDSLLEYLNCSMILNKYELKKLHHQRNLILNNAMLLSNSNSNSNNNNNNNCSYNRQRNLLSHHNKYHHQLSSGYNSENHSNSSNSTTSNYQISNSVGAVAAAAASSSSSSQQSNILNFYRLSSSYLPLTSYHNHHQNHHQSNNMSNSAFMGIQCTCGASDLNNSKRPNSASSPIILPDEEEEEEEDEDDDDDDDEDEDEDDELDVEDEIEEIEIMTKSLNVITSSLNSNNNNNSSHKKFNSNNSTIKTVITPSTPTTINRNYKIIKPSESSTTTNAKDSYCGDTIRLNTQLQRASGTSSCHHTARIDMRRVRSFRDLTQSQLIFSPHDFLIEEKLGEGFFANVKKIVSKESRQEMVLKELKISCAPPPAPPPPPPPPAATTTTTTDTTDSSSCSSLLETAPKLDLLLNYAELNAAHKSFLKEAQVLRNLSHPNVIKFMGIMFTKEKHLNLILEYISGGTLKDIIHNISNVLPWKMRVGYAQDIAAAMEYLHSLNIIHRDLKSDNCLVRENGRTVVVADFGLSRICNYSNNTTTTTSRNNNNNSLSYLSIKNSDAAANSSSASSSLHKIQTSLISNLITQSPQSSSATNSFIVAAKRKLKRRGDNHHQQQQRRQQRYAVVGNSFSMAPEMLKHQIYDERVDIFSFGIICCEIIGRVQADPDYLPRTSDFGLNVELFRKKYCEADCPKHFIKIAIACCELEPEKRPPFSKTHLWLETILAHLEANNPIPKNLLKNILDQNNTKRPLSNNILGDLLPKI